MTELYASTHGIPSAAISSMILSVLVLLAAFMMVILCAGRLLAGTRNGNSAVMYKKTNAAIMQLLLKNA